jgi:hypothetical protein
VDFYYGFGNLLDRRTGLYIFFAREGFYNEDKLRYTK